MAYSKSLAARIRDALADRRGIEEKQMFGGLGFLLRGNMCVGVWKESLIARVGLDAYADALAQEFVREFDVTGRPMRGWIIVTPDGLDEDARLNEWITAALDFVTTLPAK